MNNTEYTVIEKFSKYGIGSGTLLSNKDTESFQCRWSKDLGFRCCFIIDLIVELFRTLKLFVGDTTLLL